MLGEAALDTVRERILVLRSLPNFASIDDEAATWLAEHARARRWRQGDLLLQAGQPVRHVHIVTFGNVHTVHGSRVVDVRRGFGAGFLSTLARDEQGLHAEATEPTTTLEIPADALFAVYEENFSLLRGALRNLSRSLLQSRGNLPVRADAAASDPPLGEWHDGDHTLVEKMMMLRETGLFASVNLDAVIDVARRQEPVEYAKGDEIWALDTRPTFSLRVNYGHVRCVEASGTEVLVGTEFVLGSMDALSDMPRRYAAFAQTPVQGFLLGQDPFLAALETHPAVGLDLAALLARSLLAQT